MTRLSTESATALLGDDAIVALERAFSAAGRELFVVGGAVRDAMLDEVSTDLDFATDARPNQIEEILAPVADSIWATGRAFGTIAASVAGRKVEITTYRDDQYEQGSRKPEVRFGHCLVEDLRRRDFTINAMAISLPDGELIDPFGGVQDLARRLLATPRSAAVAFDEDPLRMLRAARFVGRLGLRPTTEVEAAIVSQRERLSIVSAERIRDELSETIVLDDVALALWLLVDTHLIDQFLPEIPRLRLEQDPIHRHKDVLTHSIAVTEKTSPRLRLRLAALLHDIGKPATRAYTGGTVSFHHHDAAGAKMARKRLRALAYPKDVIDDVCQLIYLHLRVHTYKMGWSDSAVRRYVRDAGPLLDDLNELVRRDCTTRNPAKAARLAARMDELETRIDELGQTEALAKLRPALDGNEVMSHLGLRPGRVVGEALRFLMQIRLDEGEIDADEARRRLDVWAVEQDLSG